MNPAKFKKNVGMRVELTPPACEVDVDGEHERDRHDDWLIESVSDDVVELGNLRTEQIVKLGFDQIHSFTSNPQRSRPGIAHGLLRLMVQVIFQGESIRTRLVPRPGEPAVHPVRLAAKHLTVIKGGVNNGVIAQNLTIKTKRAPKVKLEYPLGSIGADVIKHNYIGYLVGRYHDFRKADASYGRRVKFHHSVIHTNIAREFKAKTYFIPISRFDELVQYLQDHILNTIQGRNNRSRGYVSFESFDEYRLKHGGEG